MMYCPIHTSELISEDVNNCGYFCIRCQKYYDYQEILPKYFSFLYQSYKMDSHKNQLIQECAELIYNLTKQRQQILSGENINIKMINNQSEEMMHVKLIIDFLYCYYPDLKRQGEQEFFNLCVKREIIKGNEK